MKALARGATLYTPGCFGLYSTRPRRRSNELTIPHPYYSSTSTLSIQTERFNYSCWTEQSITPPSLVIGIEL